MTIRDHLKYFYLKRLKFLRNRDFIRLAKTGIGGSAYAFGIGVAYYQLLAAHEDRKFRMTGQDSQIAASILANVSGFGENKLGEGKSLQGRPEIISYFH
jgi:hypothetical protein